MSLKPAPAALAAADSKLDKVYDASFGPAAEKAKDSETRIVALAAQGDASGASTVAGQDRALFQDALAAGQRTLVQLSKNTTNDVAIPDHPKYVNYYTAVGARLTARTAEYKAILSLADSPSAENTTAVVAASKAAEAREKAYNDLKTSS